MKMLSNCECAGIRERLRACIVFLAALAAFLGAGRRAAAQASESGDVGAARLAVGASATASTLGYGDRRMLGVTGWVDADTIRRFGFEGEGRWLRFHETADVHADTYLAGLRYHFNYGHFQPYVKGLVGLGKFNFPYDFATGNYFVVAGGGGLDTKLTGRWIVRADVEYQYWPEFTFGELNALSVNVGVRYRIF